MSLDLLLLGKKLRQSRESLQLKISEVSERIGIENDRLLKIESGLQEPSGDEILIIADFFKTDYNFYISNSQKNASDQVEILYRKFGQEFTKEDRWAIQEFLYLCECENYVLELLEFEKKHFNYIKNGSDIKKQGEDAALTLRRIFGYKPNMIPKDLFNDFRKIGLHIFRRKLNNKNLSGLFIKHPSIGKCVLVNYDEDIFRQNFTIAHEVGHAILDDSEDTNISFKSWSHTDLREIRANNFASNYLISKEGLKKLNVNHWDGDTVIKIATVLKVNVQTLLIKLKEIRAINNYDYERLKHFKVPKKDKLDSELQNLTDKIERSKLQILEKGLSSFYIQKCYEAYSRGFISSRRLSEMLLVDEAGLIGLLDLFHLKLDYEN